MSEHPWTSGGLRITRLALDAVVKSAVDGYATDEEACGYIVGPAGDGLLCDETVPLVNMANKLHQLDPQLYFRDARTFFAFNERMFERAIQSGHERGRPVKVMFHSHLDAGAYFSKTDRAVMSMGQAPSREGGPIALGPGPAWPLAFLVTSVRAAGVDDHKLFVWDGADFAESDFTVVD